MTNPNDPAHPCESPCNTWQTMETAPRNGTRLLCACGDEVQVCYPKLFPKPVSEIRGRDMTKSEPGDTWEYFRDEVNALGHSWSMIPTHWMPIPPLPLLRNVQPETPQ